MRKNIAVIGGFGFLGQNLVHELLERRKRKHSDDRITIIDQKENPKIHPDDLNSPSISIKTGIDITNKSSIKGQLKGIDTVYHLAAIMKWGRKNQQILHKINVDGCKNVLSECQKSNVKSLVHVSSFATVGYSNKERPLAKEGNKVDWKKEKSAYYAYSKKLGEQAMLSNNKAGLRVSVCMPGIMVGAGDLKTLPLFKVGRNSPFFVVPKGGTNYIDVRDVARGLIAIEEKGKNKEQYLITGNNMTHKSLVKAIAGHAHKKIAVGEIPRMMKFIIYPLMGMIEYIAPKTIQLSQEGIGKAFDIRYFSNKKAQQKLKWKPKYSLAETIEYAVKWYKSQGKLK